LLIKKIKVRFSGAILESTEKEKQHLYCQSWSKEACKVFFAVKKDNSPGLEQPQFNVSTSIIPLLTTQSLRYVNH
jgi:hypothetical protein